MKSFKNSETVQDEGLSVEELTRRLTDAYEGKSNLEMFKSILIEAEKSKRAGTLSNQDLDDFYASFSPMLDVFQRKALRVIIDRLKEI